MMQKEQVAKAFGTFLDEDDFPAVKRLLEEDCLYEINGETIKGKDKIVDLYQANMLEGRQKFDELKWGRSKIIKLNEYEFEVHFSDFLKHKGIEHNYNCKQILKLGDSNLIHKIIHVELPGQKEALKAFYKAVDLE